MDSEAERREPDLVDSGVSDSGPDGCDWAPQGELRWSVDTLSDEVEVRSPDLGVRYTVSHGTSGSAIGTVRVDPGQWQLVVSTSDGACNESAVESLSTCETVTFPTVEELPGSFGVAGENCRMPY